MEMIVLIFPNAMPLLFKCICTIAIILFLTHVSCARKASCLAAQSVNDLVFLYETPSYGTGFRQASSVMSNDLEHIHVSLGNNQGGQKDPVRIVR